jgi:hypothetical protein
VPVVEATAGIHLSVDEATKTPVSEQSKHDSATVLTRSGAGPGALRPRRTAPVGRCDGVRLRRRSLCQLPRVAGDDTPEGAER